MGGYESTYIYAKSLYEKAFDYSNMNSKESYLRQAYRVANSLPDNYLGKRELMRDIERYADSYNIDLGF